MMDLLTQAANSVFSADGEEDELCIPLTPAKGERPVFVELTNTINISPAKFQNSPLRALFTAPTLSTPKTKSQNLFFAANGSRNIGRGSASKSLSSPYPGTDLGTPKRNGISPNIANSGSSGKSPLTPMTNLKLLTRIASMEEAISTASKKSLFGKENQPNHFVVSSAVTSTSSTSLRRYNSECLGRKGGKTGPKLANTLRKHPTSDNYPAPSSPGNLVLEGNGRTPFIDEASSGRVVEGSRKDKSLGLLSEKFLEQFPLEVSYLETPRRLVLDEVAAMLGTERRRVYDIINVLESLNMAARVQKNMYQWTGKLHLEETLGRLKALGEKYDIASQLHALENEGKDFKIPQQIKLTRIGDNERAPDSRKEKSLSILCQKFLMILLVSPVPHIISLDNAVRLLVGEIGEDGERLRTRGRRLYDIANVLTSLGLVCRVPGAKSFQYIGPAVQSVTNDDDTFGILQKNSLLPSRNVSNSECKENISTYGNHEVTPSEVAPPVQKRGRPRKLSTAFTTSALPAAKRSRLQRTQSEDVISHQSRKMIRHPSLHDICQVAEVEREKLLMEQQMFRSRSCGGIEAGSSQVIREEPNASMQRKVVLPNSDFRPISATEPSGMSILQRRLTKRTKIPVALTFQGTEGQEFQDKIKEDLTTNISTKENIRSQQFYKKSDFCKSSGNGCLYSTNLRNSVDNTSQSAKSSASSESLNPVQPVNVIRPAFTPNQRVESDRNRKPVLNINNTIAHNVYTQSRVVPITMSGTPVIKVITKTGTSRENDSSTVMRILPASHSVTSTIKPKHIIGNSGGCFQKLSERTCANGQKITISTSKHMGSSGSIPSGKTTETKTKASGNCVPYVVYTMANNQRNPKTLSRSPSSDVVIVSHAPRAMQQLGPVKRWEMVPSGLASLTSAPLLHRGRIDPTADNESGNHRHSVPGSGSWQPSPDSSSTDSELEQIFGDPFNLSRPKMLLHSMSVKQAADNKS